MDTEQKEVRRVVAGDKLAVQVMGGVEIVTVEERYPAGEEHVTLCLSFDSGAAPPRWDVLEHTALVRAQVQNSYEQGDEDDGAD